MTEKSPELSPEQEIAKQKTQECVVCHKTLGITAFARVDPTTPGPRKYKDVCIGCEAKARDADAAIERAKHLEAKKLRAEFEAKEQARRKKREAAARYRNKKRAEARGKKGPGNRGVDALPQNKNAALEEIAQRELARRSLVNFITRFNASYRAGWVHKLICMKLEQFSRAVANEESPRLMIFMPPRSGKSEIASKTFPAWHLGKYPNHEIIASSYAVSLPIDFSRKIKDIIATNEYKTLFKEMRLDPKAQASEAWRTTKGGAYVAAGVGGGITGKGAHVLIVDDPLKDAEEADSETTRNKVWDWWGTTARTRLAPGGGVLVIQTRWHDDDLSGRLINQMKNGRKEIQDQIDDLKVHRPDGWEAQVESLEQELAEIEEWDILVFPGLAEHDEYAYPDGTVVPEPEPGTRLLRHKDEALHPERFDELALRRIKRGMQPRHWSALYQQNPVPDEGMFFTRSMFRYEERVPDYREWHLFLAGDMALGERQHNDWNVFLIGGLDFVGDLHIIDMIRFKGGTDAITGNLIAALMKYRKQLQCFGLERGQIQMAAMPAIERRLKEERLAIPFDDSLKPLTDKVARARPAQGMMQQGRVILPSNQPWVDDFVSECLRFPGGLHDDVVDALAWLVRMVMDKQPPRPKKPKGFVSWKNRLHEYTGDGRHFGGMEA